jgi:hypothetical protein
MTFASVLFCSTAFADIVKELHHAKHTQALDLASADLPAFLRRFGLGGPRDIRAARHRFRSRWSAARATPCSPKGRCNAVRKPGWLAGGQQLGSVWGHGSYLAPDWSADWLHREAIALREIWAQRDFGAAYAACSPASRRNSTRA